MIIYIECVLINNFAIDSLIAYISLLSLKRGIAWWRILIASSIGAIYALFSPLLQFTGDIVVKIAVCLLMCVIYAKPLSIKKYLLLATVYLAYSFAFGGAIIALMNMWLPLNLVLSNPSNISVGLGATLFLLILIFARKVVVMVNKKNIKEDNMRKVIIDANKRIIKENGYYDSGNTLYYKGVYPVIVMDVSLQTGAKSVGSIAVGTITGEVTKDVYLLSKIMIDNRSYDSVYCIFNKLNSKYKVLLHNDTY